MFGNRQTVRTGIDLGRGTVRLVIGRGADRLERVTHVGVENWSGDDPVAAAAALQRLLDRLDLHPRRLGRVAASVAGSDIICREVTMAAMSRSDLHQALPFEVRRHLDLEGMDSPVIDCQILENLSGGSAPEMRVLLVAAPRPLRDRALRILDEVGIEPDVVDLAPLSGLNTLAEHSDPLTEGAVALLSVEDAFSALHVWHRKGGLVTREFGDLGVTAALEHGPQVFAAGVKAAVGETVTYFRGRHRRGVSRISLAGPGAVRAEVADALIDALDVETVVLDPLAGLASGAEGLTGGAPTGPLYVTACGLCRWWDAPVEAPA
jgi:Tfp pilus assembly PilM family ATPase